jgi:subtilase family serine protease
LRAYLRLRGTGAGQSVAIVDAYDNPYATRDIKIYSKQFGLPLPCPAKGSVPGCFRFSVVHPDGFAGVNASWAMESDLDVQMVHAIAPQASITLVEAYDATNSLYEALDWAAGQNPAPAVISDSWGSAEFAGETSADQHCALSATLCVFSAGDTGNPARYPASNPYVLAVGGTTLQLSPAGQVQSEAAWCCVSNDAGGGGVSQYESRPAYQDQVNPYQGRGTPDVSFDADPYTGVAVHDTVGLDGQNGWFEIGGTSVGAPAWSGIVAAADQLRATAHKAPLAGAGFAAQKLIYGMPHHLGFGDITHGVNNVTQCNAAAGTPVTACQAHPGYDLVTGWGSPRPGIDTALASAP